MTFTFCFTSGPTIGDACVGISSKTGVAEGSEPARSGPGVGKDELDETIVELDVGPSAS